MQQIRFINRGGMYTQVVNSMVNPIKKYLPENQGEIILEKQNKDTKIWEHQIDENCFDVSFFSDVKQPTGAFCSHGIADKNYRDASTMKNYEFVFVSGKLWESKLISQGMDKNKILIVGYPKLDPIFQNRIKIPNTTGKINVLYAPTHNTKLESKTTVSSYPRLMPELEKLYGDFNIRISSHPANDKGHKITFDDLLWSDCCIADAGSTLYEALSLDIHVIMPDWLVKNNVFNNFPNSFEEQIYREQIGYHANNIEHMKELIYRASENKLDDRTTEFMEGILPRSIRGKSGQIIAEILMEIVGD